MSVGRYRLERSIAKGGMGEVWLAYDPACERRVALKKIRGDLKNHDVLKKRFLREAKITGGLTHPGVVAIYSIHDEGDEPYYTMPYVEGKTLKALLKEKPESIPALLPIFRTICETIAYAHANGVIHRDIKPENILVGTFGEVLLLDWGLAQEMHAPDEPLLEVEGGEGDLTTPGKIVGTLAYMAPERALGGRATEQTEVYALGVILYQMLTLELPFRRTNLKEYRRMAAGEVLPDPEEVAPYRDVPPRLARVVKRALAKDARERYGRVDELLRDVKSHMEGRSEWVEEAELQMERKSDWEFQENVLISKHMAITRTTEAADWVSVMLSRKPFAENTRIKTRLRVGEKGAGMGFLLSVPEAAEREHPLEGYCLWLGSDLDPFSQLFRNTVEVMHLPDLHLKRGVWHEVVIEKVDQNIHFFLDGEKRFSYISYIPLVGMHVGLLMRDADFELDPLVVAAGSQNLQVSCLSIPDAFLASKDYKRALAEYRRIGTSFPGHAEGREAVFRSGITLLEQAKSQKSEKRSKPTFAYALDEFGRLHNTPGAPLEYLGKSLVYNALRDHAEEIKCLELAVRRYGGHPLIGAVKEQLIYRMHESTQSDRLSAYQLILIALRQLPDVVATTDSKRLFKHVVANWEVLPFIESPLDPSSLEPPYAFAAPLAFWLASPYGLMEIFEELEDSEWQGNILYMLCELGAHALAKRLAEKVTDEEITPLLAPIWIAHESSLEAGVAAYFALGRPDVGVREFRTLSYLMQMALRTDQEAWIHHIADQIGEMPLSREDHVNLDGWRIWGHLKRDEVEEAGSIFDNYSLEMVNQESTILHPLFGCYLLMTENEEIAHIHFAGVIDTPFPRSWALLGHEVTNKISENPSWLSTSFLWERRRLYRQLALYHHCLGNPKLATFYRERERETYVSVPE